jgi:hypothetical protein
MFVFGAAFSIPDKRSRAIEVLKGAYLPIAIPKTQEIERRNKRMP